MNAKEESEKIVIAEIETQWPGPLTTELRQTTSGYYKLIEPLR